MNNKKITTITGNMFGGKTTELIATVNQYKRLAKMNKEEINILCFKPEIDKRYDETKIVTHDGLKLDAIPVDSIDKLVKYVEEKKPNVIVIDEVQFFDEKVGDNYVIIDLLRKFVKERDVILSGLSKDFRGMPFGPIGQILAISDTIHVKNSKCTVCGEEATMPQRLVNGEPANWFQNTVLVGANEENEALEKYEPRCRNCHVIEGDPIDQKRTYKLVGEN